jgi:hypothetical protein
MTHDYFIGYKTSNISNEDVSCVRKIPSPSILLVNSEKYKRSAKSNVQDFYPKNFIYNLAKNIIWKLQEWFQKEMQWWQQYVRCNWSFHTRILDVGADAYVLGKGLEVLSIYGSTRENVVVFDHETTIKRNLPIVSAITALDLTNGKSVILIIHESIHNETSNHSLSSQFKLREFGILIDSISHRHGGTQ